MDPITLLAIGSGVAAVGAISGAQSAKQQGEYNAAMAEQGAVAEAQQAGVREEAQRRQAGQALGEQRAAIAQSGGGFGGSAADIMRQSSTNAELDALTTRYEGDLRARGMQAEAVGERFAGKSAARAGYISAAGSLIGGVGGYMQGRANQRYQQSVLDKLGKP